MTEDNLVKRLRSDAHMTQADGLAAMLETAAEAADRIEQLTAEVERKDAEIARLHLDIEAQECLQDSAYRAGMKFGWNCAVDDDRKSYDAVMSSTEHVAVLKRIREARAALGDTQ